MEAGFLLGSPAFSLDRSGLAAVYHGLSVDQHPALPLVGGR
jgi:hypothetical protein